jgi:hypothetical protein
MSLVAVVVAAAAVAAAAAAAAAAHTLLVQAVISRSVQTSVRINVTYKLPY